MFPFPRTAIPPPLPPPMEREKEGEVPPFNDCAAWGQHCGHAEGEGWCCFCRKPVPDA